MSYAVIQTGGKQYKVRSGEILKIEKLPNSKPDSKIEFKEILAYGDNKIIEIGAVKYDIENETKEYFSQLINPVVQISEFIEDLTGISNSDVENMPIIDEVKNEFEEFYRDYQNNQHLIIAHNANFDIGFLKSNGFNFKNNIFDN